MPYRKTSLPRPLSDLNSLQKIYGPNEWAAIIEQGQSKQYIYVCMCVYVCIYMCIYVCVHVYNMYAIHVYIKYVYMCIHVYMQFEQKLADRDHALSPHQRTHEVGRCRRITILKSQHSQIRRRVKGRCTWRGKQIVSCSRPDSIIARQVTVGEEHRCFFRQDSLLDAPLFF